MARLLTKPRRFLEIISLPLISPALNRRRRVLVAGGEVFAIRAAGVLELAFFGIAGCKGRQGVVPGQGGYVVFQPEEVVGAEHHLLEIGVFDVRGAGGRRRCGHGDGAGGGGGWGS